MSQRGPAARPASYPSSRSPVKYEQGSPPHQATQHGKHDSQHEQGGATTAGSHVSVSASESSKSLGMYNLLNPAEANRMASEPPSHMTGRQVEGTYSHGPPRAYTGTDSASASLPTTPGVGGPQPPHLSRPTVSERNSPSATFPFPPTSHRRILSPKLSHVAAYKEATTPHEGDARQHLDLSGAAGTKRPYGSDSHGTVHQQHPGFHNVPPRAHSQPMQRPPEGRQGGPMPSASPSEHQSRLEGPGPGQGSGPGQYPPHTQFHHSQQSTHGPGEGVPAWSDMLRRTGLGGSGMGAEGQQAFMTLPGSETPIAVQVDYSQASKKADEKRQRNAKASTRHRRKKKTIQEENVRQIQEMREERDDLADQIEHVTRQRDFYRDERNRLRDIVLRTPAIAQHASGPPSPTSVRSVTSFPDRSPVAPSRQMPTPSQGYVSESSSVERPAQRRRTDERPEYPGNYSTQAGPPPSTLPPMHGHVQGMPPRPSSASSLVPLERLPPLRTIEGHHPPPDIAHGQPHERDPATGDWRPAPPRPYETGWATPRNAGDVGPPR